MGCNDSREMDGDAGKNASKNWDRQLQGDYHNAQQIHKLLLLGTGNSGKSTFFKQLKQIHGEGYVQDEFNSQAKHIQDSVVVQMKHLLGMFQDPETEEFKDTLPNELLPQAKKVATVSPEMSLQSVANEIETLWAHQTIKQAYTNRTNLGIADSAPRFFDDLQRITSPNYEPEFDDLLLARIPTAGMMDKLFEIKGSKFRIFDVGGQRSERNKWIHCFDTVHGILFVASLSCYDQSLYEEDDANAMHESLELFGIVSNSRYFARASIILFLNKSDLFAEKIKMKPLSICFPSYDGPNTFNEAIEYIMIQYKERISARRDTKTMYTHITCATDRSNVRKVFDDVQHAVVTDALRQNGLI